jgi:hypothetical protein
MVNSVIVFNVEAQVEVTPVMTGPAGEMENSLPFAVTLEHLISFENTTLSNVVLHPTVVTLLITGGVLSVITAVPPRNFNE